jgi:hypothetical protein
MVETCYVLPAGCAASPYDLHQSTYTSATIRKLSSFHLEYRHVRRKGDEKDGWAGQVRFD